VSFSVPRVPLVVEVWHRDRQLSKDVMLGTTRLPLVQIITAEKMKIMVGLLLEPAFSTKQFCERHKAVPFLDSVRFAE